MSRQGPPELGRVLTRVVNEAMRHPDPLQAELLVSHLLGQVWASQEFGRMDAVAAMALDAAATVPAQAPAAPLALRLLAELAPPQVASAMRGQVSVGIPTEPSWLESVNRVELVDGITVDDVYGDQTNYVMGLAYLDAQGRRLRSGEHGLVVLVDHNLHLVKDMFARPGDIVRYFRDSVASDPSLIGTPLDPQTAATQIAEHLRITDMTLGETFGEESAEVRLLVGARLRAALPPPLEEPHPDPWDVWPQRKRRSLVTAFLRTQPVAQLLEAGSGVEGEAPPSRDTVRLIADLLVDYAIDYGAGDPLRWSPIAAELFLTDWAPRKVVWDAEDVPWVAEVLDLFVVYAGRRKRLPHRWVEMTQDAVAEYAADFTLAVLDGGRRGPAAQIIEQMLLDGVDPTDPVQMQAWIDRYNGGLPPLQP